MRFIASLLLAYVLATTAQAKGRAFGVEDLLSLEDIGHAAFSADERWLVYETFAPWKTAPAFDRDFLIPQGLGRLLVVDLRGEGRPRPLLVPRAGAGDTLGALSPGGDKAIVFRLEARRRELGVVTLATGAVMWTGLHVEPEVWTASAIWRSNSEILTLARAPETASLLLGRGWQIQARTEKAWNAAARGGLSVIALGAGRYASTNPPAPMAELTLLDSASGTARVLARGRFSDLNLAPNGDTLALIEDAETIIPTATTVLGSGYERRRRLVMVDLAAGRQTRPCPRCDLLPFVWSWSPDSVALAASARLDGEGLGQARYWRFTAAGQMRPLSTDLIPGDAGGRDKLPLAGLAWPGRAPIVLGRRTPTAALDWWRLTARGPVSLTKLGGGLPQVLAADGRNVLLRTQSGLLAVTGDGAPRAIAIDSLAATGDGRAGTVNTAVVATDGDGATLIEAKGAQRALGPWPKDVRVMAIAPRTGQILAERRDAHGVRDLVLRQGAHERVLARVNEGLASIAFTAPLPVRHPGADGKPLTSWLYLPPAPADTADIPIVVVPYPGSRYDTPPLDQGPGELKFDTNIQLMAAAGYAVIVPSLPLARGAEPMPGLADAMLRAVDQARADHPALSAERLAVWGQSYGGYGALAAGLQSPRFKAVIASAAVTNLIARHGAMAPAALATPEVLLQIPGRLAWAESGQGRMGVPPWKDPDRYVRNSPALQVDRMTAPVMLIYADLDTDAGEVQAVFASLYRLGKDAQLLLYRGEQHVVVGPDNVRDLYARAFGFLRESLARPAVGVTAKPEAMRASQ